MPPGTLSSSVTDDARHVVFKRGRTLERDEFGGFPKVEPAGDPFGLFAFGALAVEQIDGAIKLEEDAAQGFDFLGERFAEREGGGADAPFLAGEETAGGQGGADELGSLWRSGVI